MRDLTIAESEILTALICELKASTAEAVSAVDACVARAAALAATNVEREALCRSKAESEFSVLDVDAFAELCDPAAGRRR